MNATASSFLGWLLRSSWQAAVLTVLVLLAQFCLRKRLDGRWRHLLWLLVLARLAMPFSPPSSASLFNYLRFEPAPTRPHTVPSVDFAAMPQEPPIEAQPSVSPQIARVTELPSAKTASAPVLTMPAKSHWTVPQWPVLLALVWGVGVVALTLRVVIQNILFRRRLRQGTAIGDPDVLELFENCKASMGVNTLVRLVETGLVDSPALYDLFRPRLLLPPRLAERFSRNELRHIFLHELAHVRRRDMAAQWLVMCFQIVHWFNPILWFGFRRMAADRELACDELALSVVGDSEGPAYGQTIIKLLEACSEMPALPGLVGILEDKSQIFQRVSMIAQFKKHPRWSLAGAIAAVALGLATLTGAQTEKAPEVSRPDLTGTVRMGNGQPAQATVFIFTAGPRAGTSPFCPSCYPDCNKSAKTDGEGRFKIKSLDPQLLFRVLVVGKDCAPSSVAHVDPAVKPIDVTLEPVRQGIGPDRQMKGRVVDVRGKPILDAVVNIRGVTRAGGTQFGGNKDVDQLAVTDDDGKFVINAENKFDAIGVDIEALGFARGVFQNLATGGDIHELKLTEGATVKGRLVKDGQPLAGVDICISDDDRRSEAYAGNFSVGTDKDGKFVFVNVPPDRDYMVTATMDSLGTKGSTPGKNVRVKGDNSIADAGDVQVVQGFTVAGKIRLSDGHPVPPKTEVLLSRPAAWDASHCEVDDHGNFRFLGVPPGSINLSARIKGYHLSDHNKSLDYTNFRLEGVVNADKTDLIVEFEPGERHRSDVGAHADLRGYSLAGVEPEKPAKGEFHVTGAVIDAETRKPLDAFAITKGYDDPAPLGPIRWITTLQGTNGRFNILLDTNYFDPHPANVITIQADGYMPQSSGILTGETNITLALRRGPGRTGVVLRSDGQPASGVTVYLTDQHNGVYVQDKTMEVRRDIFRGTRSTNTDNQGKFTFKPGLDDSAVLVLEDAGFAQVGVQELSEHPEVKLQPWSKVQGQLMIGSRPRSNETIQLQPAFNILDGYRIHDFPPLDLYLKAQTDGEGRFSFDRVPPIDIKVYHDPWARDGKLKASSESQTVSFSLNPGEVKTVTLGGKGRPVIGQLVVNGYDGKINWRTVPQHFNLILPPSTDFDDHQTLLDELNEKIEAAASNDERGRLWHERTMLEYETALKRHAFIKTEKGKEYFFQSKTYDMDTAPDGTFRIEDVPGGNYSMHFFLPEGDWPRSHPSPPIANFTKDFEIPESSGGRSDEPFNLGKIEIQATKNRGVGKTASDPDAKPTARSDWSGRRLREPGLADPSQRLTAAEADALEAKLVEDPEDFSARRDLLVYYGFRDRGAKAKHVLWIIEHHPEFSASGPEMSLDPIIEGSSYRQGKALWLKNVKDNPTNSMILGNAAAYFIISDHATAEELLTKAQILEPQNPTWPERLGQLYKLEANGQPGTNVASKALAEFEKAQSQTSPATAGNPRLVDLAQMAIEAGDLEKARTYASELLGPGLRWSGGGNSGRALFYGNLVLGRIALREGKLDEASQYLLKAGKTTGDPALDSFGPNMSLAKELLEKGKTNSVLEFFQECGKFWPQYGGENKMGQWTAEVKAGRTPNFGANLVY